MYSVRKPKQKKQETEQTDTATQAFLREVDDALHEEKLKNLWQQWRSPLIVAIIALFAFVAGKEYWQEHQSLQRQQGVDSLFAAVSVSQPEQQQRLQTLTQNKLAGVKMLAQFQIANNLVNEGKVEEASVIYAEAAADNSLPENMRAIANLYAGMSLMAVNPQKAEAYFTLLDTTESPYRPTALEMMAELAQNRGDIVTAIALWEKIQIIANVPPTLQQRAQRRVNGLKTEKGI